MSIRKPAPRTAVKLIRDAFTQANGDLSTKQAYDLLARLEGFKNWTQAAPVLGAKNGAPTPPKQGYTRDEVAGWPVYTVAMRYEGPDFDEVMYVLPQGVHLSDRVKRYGAVDESGAKRMPNVFAEMGLTDKQYEEKLRQSFVVAEAYSIVARPEKYGLPLYANELGIKDWVREDLGWNYLAYADREGESHSAVSVAFYDSGDDSAGRFWLEIVVEPSVAQRLEKALALVPEAVDTED